MVSDNDRFAPGSAPSGMPEATHIDLSLAVVAKTTL